MGSLAESLMPAPDGDMLPKQKTSLRLAHVVGIWSNIEEAERWNREFDFFGHIELAKDGGLSDIRPEKLLYSTQYVTAAMSVIFIVINTLYVTTTDFRCVFHGQCGQQVVGTSAEAACIKGGIAACSDVDCISRATAACKVDPTVPQPFMIARWLLFDEVPAERIIACLEFFGLWALILRTVRLSMLASCASMEVFRWVCVVQIFWQTIPSLSCFSLMRLLYYVTPSVIGTEAYYAFTWTRERIEQDGEKNWWNTWPLARYLLTRFLCAVIGFDAFLMKFRVASHGVLHESPGLFDVLAAVIFLFQVLGVVNLTWFVRERLFLFIFGGENGDMTNEQKAREIVWNAMVARKVYNNLGLVSFLTVMLGFDDYDFQVLVMEHKHQKFRKSYSDSTHPVCPKGHSLYQRRTPLPRCDVCFQRFMPMAPLWGCGRCNFDACERCKYETRVAVQGPVKQGDDIFERLQSWLLSMAIES